MGLALLCFAVLGGSYILNAMDRDVFAMAECGGNAMCATCHVHVDETWTNRLPPIAVDEDALIDGVAAERRPTSRLSCQIIAAPELEGMIMRLPERQV